MSEHQDLHQTTLPINAASGQPQPGDLQALEAFSRQLSGSLGSQAILESLADALLDLLGAERCSIFVRDLHQPGLRCALARGLSQEYLEAMTRLLHSQANNLLTSDHLLVMPDARCDPRLSALWPFIEREGFCSVLLAALRHQDVTLGTFAAYYDQPATFDEQRLLVAQTLANQATVALVNARLLEESRRRNEYLLALQRAGTVITATLDLQQILQSVVGELQRTFGYALVSVHRVGGEELVLEAAAAADRSVQLPSPTRLTEGIISRVVRSQQSEYIADVRSDPDYLSVIPDVISEAAVPILVEGRVWGVLNVETLDPAQLTAADVTLLEMFSNQIAVAIRNARLYAESQQRVAELEALRRVSLQLASSLDTQALIELIVESAMALVKPAVVHLYLYDEQEGRFTLGTALWESGERRPAVSALRPDGITARAARQREPLIINDALNHPLYGLNPDPKVRAWGVTAIGAFPLVRPNGVVGVLTASFTRPFTFDESVTRVLSLFADQAAIAIENARLYQTLQQHAAEMERLKEFNERIVQGVEEGILLEDANDRVIFVNPRFCEMVGYSQEELLGQPSHRLLTPQMEVLVKRQAAQRPQGKKGRYEAALLRKDGSQVPVLISATPLFQNDTYQGTLAVFTDITQRKRTEETLLALNAAAAAVRRAETPQQVYSTISQELQQLGLSAAIFRLGEDQQTAILEHVALAGRLATLAGDVVASLPDRLRVSLTQEGFSLKAFAEGHAQFLPNLADQVMQVLDDLTGTVLRQTLTRQTSELLRRGLASYRAIVAPLVRQQQRVGLLAVISDQLSVADIPAVEAFANQTSAALDIAHLYEEARERAARLAVAYEELRDLDRMKDEFVQNVSHELRTPLTFVRGYVEYLLEGIAGELNEEQREALTIVLDRTDAIIHLVNDIISLKRADMEALNLVPLALEKVAEASVRGAHHAAKQAGVNLHLEYQHNLPRVMGDKKRLGEVFDNLIGNALKFSPDGGVVTIRLQQMGHVVEASVSDTGIGIPADQLDKIWTRFYQVDSSTTRRFGGTGLGLAIVKRIVEAHRGEVWVESEPGQGSTFYFTVPVAETK